MHGSQPALGAGTERMPTFRQRLLSLASGDGEKRAAWLAAYKFARQVNETQVAHVEGQERRILPQGGLEAAATWSDDDLTEFLDFLVLVKLSYQLFV